MIQGFFSVMIVPYNIDVSNEYIIIGNVIKLTT